MLLPLSLVCVVILLAWFLRRHLAASAASSSTLLARYCSLRHPVTLFSLLPPSSSVSSATSAHYLITGAHGFVASHLVEALIARGEQNITLVDLRDSTLFQPERSEKHSKVKFVQMDLTKASLEDFVQLLQGVDVVFHFAARVDFWKRLPFQYPPMHAANVKVTELLLQASVIAGVRKFLHASSIHVVEALSSRGTIAGGDESLPYPAEGDELGHYGRTKRLAEEAVLRANGKASKGNEPLATIALRCPGMFGPRDSISVWQSILNEPRMRWPHLVRMDWCYIGNVAYAFLKAEEALKDSQQKASGKVYFIQGRAVRELTDLGESVRRVLGHKTTWIPLGFFLVSARVVEFLQAAFGDGVNKYIGDLAKLTPIVMHLIKYDSWYSDAAAERDFGYRPVFSYDDGVEQIKLFCDSLGYKTVSA